MTLAMLARCDDGGLGTMTWEAWRHLQPTRTLVVRSRGPACGAPHPERYQGGPGSVRVAPGLPQAADEEWLLNGATVLYSAETWYTPTLEPRARRAGVRTFLHVMPEYLLRSWRADVFLAPTPWLAPANAVELPVPIARDRLPRREQRPKVRTLYHVDSPTKDRNGTQLLLDAMPFVRESVRLLIRTRGERWAGMEYPSGAQVEWLPARRGPYYEAWPEDVDAFVQPRRFGGLSLPVQEAASLGLPIIALDRDPEFGWPIYDVPGAHDGSVNTWRDITVPAYTARPEDIAEAIDLLATDAAIVGLMSVASDAWAESLSWPQQLESYRSALCPSS